jgi:hypothetical protein
LINSYTASTAVDADVQAGILLCELVPLVAGGLVLEAGDEADCRSPEDYEAGAAAGYSLVYLRSSSGF